MELGINLSINGQSRCNGAKVRLANTNPQNTTSLALLFLEPFVSLFLLRQQKHNKWTTTIKWLLITMNFEHQREQKISLVSKRKCIFLLDCTDCTQPTKWSHSRIRQRSLKGHRATWYCSYCDSIWGVHLSTLLHSAQCKHMEETNIFIFPSDFVFTHLLLRLHLYIRIIPRAEEENLIHNKHLKKHTTVKSVPYNSYSGGKLIRFLVGFFSGIGIKWLCDGPQSSPSSVLSTCCQFSLLILPPLSSLWNRTLCYWCSEIRLHLMLQR